MIPFLKKNKDGGKKPPKSMVPRTAQESIPFQRMFEDGTCRVRPGYHSDFSVMDGGQLGAPELTIQEAREQILEAHHMEKGRRLLQDYDVVMDKVAEAEELSVDHRPSTLEKLAELASDTSAPQSSARSAPEL